MMREEAISLPLANGWSSQSVAVWLRADGRCEYCNRDLLGCEDAHFHGSHIDHIVPKHGDNLENLALSCTACNYMKRNRAFNVEKPAMTRAELITAAREHIQGVRDRNRDRLKQSVQWLTCCGLKR